MPASQAFRNAKTYSKALADNSSLAIIPFSMAAELLEVEVSTVQGYVRRGTLSEISVGPKRRWVGVLASEIRQKRRVRAKLLRDLIKIAEPILVQAAKDQKTLEYNADLMIALDLKHSHAQDRDMLGKVLGELSKSSNKSDNCMISVVAVRKKDAKPNKAFFALARSLNVLAATGDENQFFKEHKETVYKKYLRK